MSRNVEIKANISNLDSFLEKCKELTQSAGEIIPQEDYFFNAQHGRLKLRIIEGKKSELIAYMRPDGDAPKLSEYDKCEIADGDNLCKVLTRALGVSGTVKKTRYLFLDGQTRIHVDNVSGLGAFMELEVVLSKNQTTEDGQIIAEKFLEKLDINKNQLISCAYVDLLNNKYDDVPQ